MQPFAAEMSYSDKPRGVFRSPSKGSSGGNLLLCNEPVTSDEHTAGNNGPANWLYRL